MHWGLSSHISSSSASMYLSWRQYPRTYARAVHGRTRSKQGRSMLCSTKRQTGAEVRCADNESVLCRDQRIALNGNSLHDSTFIPCATVGSFYHISQDVEMPPLS
jgi:hypothetical protein